MFTKKYAYYRVTKNNQAVQPYHWVLVAPNGEIIMTSENYSSKQMVSKGIESAKVNCTYDENYERKDAKDGSPMFNLIAQNGEIIGTSEIYSTEASREVGIEAVKRYGRDAEMHNETGEAKDNDSNGGAKPIVSPQKPWISC